MSLLPTDSRILKIVYSPLPVSFQSTQENQSPTGTPLRALGSGCNKLVTKPDDIRKENQLKRKLKHIDIEITKKCNLSCVHCSAQSNVIGNELSAKEIITILENSSPLGLKKIGFTGGEPLKRRSKLLALLEYRKRNLDSETHLHTNATLLTSTDSKLLAESVDEITVTLYGIDSETHDAITSTEGSLRATEEGVRKLIRDNANLTIFVVPMKTNLRQIPEIIGKMREVGCHRFRILSLSPTGRARNNFQTLSLDHSETEWLSSQLIKTRVDLGVDIDAGFCTRQDYPGLGKLQGHQSCLAAEDRIHIGAFGDVFPCTAASGWQHFSGGNIRDHGLDPSVLWETSPIFQFLRFYHSNPPIRCRSCDTFGSCMGGCRVVMHYKYGNITAIKPECESPTSSLSQRS